MKNNILRKNFIWNVVGVSFNAFTSLFFLIIVTRINGADQAGLFTFAFSLALLFEVIGYYAGRVYQVTESNKKISDIDYIYSHFITSLLMIAICIIFSFIKGYDFNKTLLIFLMTLFRSIESFSDTFYAIIQKNNRLYKVGKSFFIKALLSLTMFLLIDYVSHNMILATFAIVIIQFFVLLFYDYMNAKKYYHGRNTIRKDAIILIFKNGFFTFAFMFLTQYLINAPKYAIDSLLPNSYQTKYGIIAMPATIIILITQFLIHPFLLKLTNYIKNKEYLSFHKMVLKMVLVLILIGAIGATTAYLVGIPVLELVYSINLNNYQSSLLIIIIGATLYGIVSILSNALITIRKTFIQMIVFIITSIFAYFISTWLTMKYSIYGSCNAYLISMLILLLLFIIIYIIYFRRISYENKNIGSNT